MMSSDDHHSTSNRNPQEWAIQARGLTRFFGGKCAVNGLSFNVPRGSVLAFIGRNGAGKTTTIRMLLGLLTPTRGQSTILGHDSTNLPPQVRARIGYMAEGHPVYPWMRVAQYAGFQSRGYPHWRQSTFAAVIDYFAIPPQTKAGDLSHGQRAGLHLATTLAIEPELLMLDDPATGLDPAARRSLLEAMIYFTRNRERTIFFSTHLLDDVERIADQVAVLDYSVLRASCSVETFRDRVVD
jgi:ABC-2 type transport system ATP-binding protein